MTLEHAARAASLGLVLALLALAGCKPGTGSARGDAGADARAPADAGVLDAGAASGALAPDAATVDEGALPPGAGDELTLRAQHLFEAIVRDNPDLASDILFPRDAFVLAHDATDPGKVWDAKVVSSFRRGVHSLNKRTKGIERAQFVSFEIGRTVTQAAIRHHEWKESLWRVPHARLTFMLDGRTARFDIGELTSWRGAWYVTRLR
jgi:hypothetical protein